MRKSFFLILTMLGATFLLGACDTFTDNQPTPVVYESVEEDLSGWIISDGEVVPNNDLQIISITNGRVEEVLVEEGQIVQAGQILIRLETPEQLLAELKSAQLDQLIAKQALDDLNLNGNLRKQKAYQRVLDAQSARRDALAAWDEFDEDQYDKDLETIKEEVIDARQDLDDAKEDLKDFLDLEEDNPQRRNRQDDVDEAQLALQEVEREQAALEQTRDQLQLNLDLSEAEEDAAWDEYRKFKQDNVPADQLALLENQLDTANARITALEASITDLEITTPMDGTVISIDPQAGEWVSAGQLISVVADFSTWFVESTDTNENKIVDIQVGDLVTLEFDAFPGESVRGKVIEIKDLPTIKYSDVIYPIRIELMENELPLRWKMSVVIKIEK
jgi:multidrug resistance efflux pump